jgi:hypothetical protein
LKDEEAKDCKNAKHEAGHLCIALALGAVPLLISIDVAEATKERWGGFAWFRNTPDTLDLSLIRLDHATQWTPFLHCRSFGGDEQRVLVRGIIISAAGLVAESLRVNRQKRQGRFPASRSLGWRGRDGRLTKDASEDLAEGSAMSNDEKAAHIDDICAEMTDRITSTRETIRARPDDNWAADFCADELSALEDVEALLGRPIGSATFHQAWREATYTAAYVIRQCGSLHARLTNELFRRRVLDEHEIAAIFDRWKECRSSSAADGNQVFRHTEKGETQ